MKEGQLVRKIYVKALDDLPKDNKKYAVLWKGNDFHRMHGRTMQRYFNEIDWYLQPVEEQESKEDQYRKFMIKLGTRLIAGRDFLMTQDPKYLTVEDCLEAFGFTRDGLNEIV